jgi:DNA-binding PadR family transcriptional regulator
MERGMVRELVLAALVEGPAHGYELMGRLEAATGGRWRPSPGSVYPLLQLLEDQGLVRGRDEGGRRVFELTDEGRAAVQPRLLETLAGDTAGAAGSAELRDEVRRLHLAARQVGMLGDEAQVTRAVTMVREARQALFRLLAE